MSMNHAKPISKPLLFIGITIIATILIMGVVYSGTFYGSNANVKIKNKGDASYSTAKIAWYMDTTDSQCTDSDGGFKPKDGGYMSFVDGQGTMQLVFEQCTGPKTLAELSCVKNVNVLETNGKDKHNYALITTTECATKCVQGTGIFATAKCQ